MLFFYYFYVSPLPTLAHTIAKGSTFSIGSRFDVTKLQKKIVLMSHRLADFGSQWQWTQIFIHLTTLMAMGTQLCFKRHRESFFIPKTVVTTLLSVIIFTGRPLPPSPFTGARGAHKQHQGYIYSYHRVHNSY